MITVAYVSNNVYVLSIVVYFKKIKIARVIYCGFVFYNHLAYNGSGKNKTWL